MTKIQILQCGETKMLTCGNNPVPETIYLTPNVIQVFTCVTYGGNVDLGAYVCGTTNFCDINNIEIVQRNLYNPAKLECRC